MTERNHRISQPVSFLTLVIVLALVGALAPAGVGAAQATPEPEPDPTGPNHCRVEPRSLSSFVDALTEPIAVASPEAPSPGEPAAEATVAAITATVQTAIACRNAGDFPRAYALFSDRLLVQLFGSIETVPPEIESALQEEPQRVRRPRMLQLVEIAEPRLLPDGRVAATVVTANATHTFTDELIFTEADGQWLIDQVRVLPPAPAGATPIP